MPFPPLITRTGRLILFAVALAGCFPGNARSAEPLGILLSNNTAQEWSPPETVVGILSAEDEDLGDSHGFTLVPGLGDSHNGAFKIVGNELRLPYGLNLDYETNLHVVFTCRIRATDSAGSFVEQAFEISILDDSDEDTDGDGLIESEEDGHGTSDLRFDSDSDGVGDARELEEGTSPTDPAAWPQVAIVGWGDAANSVQAAPSGGEFIGLATGEEHSLALRSDGVVMAWGGWGTFGQNQPPAGLTDVVDVSAGGDYWIEDTAFSVAVRNDGSVVFWGCDFEGGLLPPVGLAGVAAVSAGRTHCLALKSDGTVVEWGLLPHEGSAMPPALGGVVAVAAGGFHSLALREDGSVVAWGSGFDGNEWRAFESPAGLTDIVAIAAGRMHSLALKIDGTVTAWGYNSHGQATVPPGLSGVVAVAAGGFHSLALKADGSVVAWGLNSHGQTVVPPSAMSHVRRISAGNFHSLAVRQNEGFPAISSPATVTGEPGVTLTHQVIVENAVPIEFSAAGLPPGLSIDPLSGLVSGSPLVPARCLARIQVATDQGMLSQALWFGIFSGSPPSAIEASPAQIAENSADGAQAGVLLATDSDVGDLHTFELVDGNGAVDNGRFRIEGDRLLVSGGLARDYEQDSSPFSVRVRARDSSLNTFDAVLSIELLDDLGEDADGDGLSQADESLLGTSDLSRDTDGDGFGDVFESARGTDPASRDSVPAGRILIGWGGGGDGRTAPQPGTADFIDVSAGGAHSLAVTSAGLVAAWGADSEGQTTVPDGLSGVVAVDAGDFHSVALRSDGSVVAWGNNDAGQTEVPGNLEGVVEISAGGYHTLALLADGTVAAWGDNRYGQCDVPAGLAGVVAVAAGGFHSLALKSDGTVQGWGSDWQGTSTVPDGLVGVVEISAGSYHSLALRHDGTVTAWGSNGQGQTDVPGGLGSVASIAAGALHSVAVKVDGSLVGWGANDSAQCDVPPEALAIGRVDAGGRHNLALRQDGGFPGIQRPPVVRSWPGEELSFRVTLEKAVSTDFWVMGLPDEVTLDPFFGEIHADVVTGWSRAARFTANTSEGQVTTVVWIDTSLGVAPSGITLEPAVLRENSPQGTVVGVLTVADSNAGDTHELSLAYSGPDDYRFELVGNQLVVRYPLDADFDAGVSSLTIVVRAIDSGGNVAERNLSIGMIDDRLENADGDAYDEQTEEDVLGTSDRIFDDFASADPDHDGVPSLIEYAFNLDPKTANPTQTLVPDGGSTAGLPSVTLVDAGGGHERLRLEYLRRTDGGLIYTPEFGSALDDGSLRDTGSQPLVTPVSPGWERCVVLDVVGSSVAPSRFARVRVSW